MLKRISATTLVVLAALASAYSISAQSNLSAKVNSLQPPAVHSAVESDRIKDGLIGPVRRVRTEVVKLLGSQGRLIEGKRSVLEIVAYDVRGNKIENQYFPVAGATLTGKETYTYDDKGNISEMVLLNDDGSLLGKEHYKYEFDFAGNWNKMTTSVAVIDSGRVSFEPTEITYRSIMYYLDEKMVKMAQPSSLPAPSNNPSPNFSNAASNADPAKPSAEPKPQPSVEAVSERQPLAEHNVAAALPSPTTRGDALSANPAEVKSAASNSASSPRLDLDSEPPPVPSPKPILRPVSGGVLNGAALYLPSPVYPETAKRMRTAGVVMVEVVIDENGKVISVNADKGPAILREAATQAAMKARFTPTKLSGQPVKVFGTISYRFSLAP